MAEVQEDVNPFDTFPAEVVQDVEGLIWLGHLEDEFEFCGHEFVLRTLKAEEELQAALLVKEYGDTIGQAKAWAWANIALALTSIDGDQDFCPSLGPDKSGYARARFKWITSRWYWPVGNYIFARYASLVQRQADAVNAVADLSSRNLHTSTPSVDSLIDKGVSLEDLTPSNFDSFPTS